MREDERKEKDTPRGPNNTNRDDEGEKDSNELSLLHGSGEGLTRGNKRKVEGRGFGFFSEGGGGEPMLCSLRVERVRRKG